jgi:GxxExxY protein
MNTDIVFKEESFKIIGACFEVYNNMGHGFLETVYQECLAIEFSDLGLPFVEQPHLKLKYKTKPLKQTYLPDFLCFDEIIVEIKAAKSLTDEHRAQVINYLKATGKKLALLVNFGHYPKLEYERFLAPPHSCNSRNS